MAEGKVRVQKFLTEMLDRTEKTQLQIAREIGYERANIITMFKQGLTKVPINKIAPLARSVGADPEYMLRLALHEYIPDVWASIEDILVIPTKEEAEIIKFIRAVTGEPVPRMRNAGQKAKLREFSLSLGQ